MRKENTKKLAKKLWNRFSYLKKMLNLIILTALFEMFGWPNFNPNQAGEEFYQDFFVNGDMDETRAWEIYNAFTPLPAALVFGSTDAIDVAKKIIAKRDLNTQLQFDIGPAKQIALVKGYDDVVNLINHKFARKY
jgi:hypothetical protein